MLCLKFGQWTGGVIHTQYVGRDWTTRPSAPRYPVWPWSAILSVVRPRLRSH